MVSPTTSSIADEKYVSFTTFTKDGRPKPVPVWIARRDGVIGFTTAEGSWKLRRLANDPRCELTPCDGRGRVTEGAATVTGTARQATAEEFDKVKAAIGEKYGIWTKLIPIFYKIQALVTRKDPVDTGGTAIVIDLD